MNKQQNQQNKIRNNRQETHGWSPSSTKESQRIKISHLQLFSVIPFSIFPDCGSIFLSFFHQKKSHVSGFRWGFAILLLEYRHSSFSSGIPWKILFPGSWVHTAMHCYFQFFSNSTGCSILQRTPELWKNILARYIIF